MLWHHWFMNYGGLAFGAMLIVGLVKLGILVALVALGVVLVRRLSRPNQPPEHPPEDVLAVLKARYARGEITREQFLQMKDDLK